MTKTSNYIKYCLKGNNCDKANGCFHFWAPDAKFKDKILIYGPNGSGKSSLIKELISQSKTLENTNNQEIMVFDDAFIHTHIFEIKENAKNKEETTKKQSNYSKKKALPEAFKFHTDDLIKWRNKKEGYETQKKELNDHQLEQDNQLFEWFFDIISEGKNQELPKVHKSFAASWKKYWKDNDDLIDKNYKQKNYDWLKESWTWSFDDLKKQISNNFPINIAILKDIKNDFINKNNKYSKTHFFDFLQRKNKKIKENFKKVETEVSNYKKFLKSFKLNKQIFEIWSKNFDLKIDHIEKFFTSLKDKSKILTWYHKGIKLYNHFNLNEEKCIFCFQKFLTKKDLYEELKSYSGNNKRLSPNLKIIEEIHNKTINVVKAILAELNRVKIETFALKDEINNIINSKKLQINFKSDQFDSDKLVDFYNQINNSLNVFLNKYHDDELKDESISYNFIAKNFEKDDFKKIIIQFKSAQKRFEDDFSDKISCLQKKIKKEEKELQKELQNQLNEIQKKWNFPITIELENSKDSKGSLINIIGEKDKKMINYLSVGELKSLAIIIFFLYLKRKIFKKNQEIQTDKEYLIVFDDVFDGLDFTAAFRFNNLLKWLIEDFNKNIKKSHEPSKQFPKMILLTHQFDFITFFHNQDRNYKIQENGNKEQKFDFFRLFKKIENSKSRHNFIPLNLNELIQTKLMVLRKYFNKMLEQFEKYASNQKERLSSDLIDQVIFWSITKLTLEIILTNKINLQGEKVNWGKNCNQSFEKYLKELFDKSEKEKKIQEKNLKILKNSQENILPKDALKEKNLKILQDNIVTKNILKILKKWKPRNETFVFISQKNNENKICNISQKNLFLMTQTIKDFLFEIKIINQTENKKFEKQINHFLNKYKKYSDDVVEIKKESYTDGLNTTIELRMLEQRLKKLLEKIYSNNNEQKENLYVEYVLLQRAIFFLKEGYKEALKEKNKKTFTKALKKVLNETPEKAPKEVLKELLKKTLKETLEKILEETPKETLEEVLEEVLKETFKEVLKKTHKEAHKEALEEVLEEVLEEACANENESQEDDSSLFTFLRHANNNFFPSLLMFDASFEKILESKKQNKSIIIQKLLKIN